MLEHTELGMGRCIKILEHTELEMGRCVEVLEHTELGMGRCVEEQGPYFRKVVMLRKGAIHTKQNLSNAREFVVC